MMRMNTALQTNTPAARDVAELMRQIAAADASPLKSIELEQYRVRGAVV